MHEPVWVLTDNRPGHKAQSLGLAQALGTPYQVKALQFNLLAHLPNFLLGSSLAHLADDCWGMIAPPWPRLVIAAGRRTVPVMRHIHAQSPHTKLIQLMWPGRYDPFDAIITPFHDVSLSRNESLQDARIIRSIGALHPLTDEKLEQARATFAPELAQIPSPYIALLIGGGMSEEAARHLCDLAELLCEGGSLLISTSRRTPKSIVKTMRDRLTCQYWLHQWSENNPSNPYLGFLANADAIIVTADSISMMSEACFTGKPVFLYPPHQGMKPKHRRFTQQIVPELAGWLTPESQRGMLPEARLDEATRIAAIIREKGLI